MKFREPVETEVMIHIGEKKTENNGVHFYAEMKFKPGPSDQEWSDAFEGDNDVLKLARVIHATISKWMEQQNGSKKTYTELKRSHPNPNSNPESGGDE